MHPLLAQDRHHVSEVLRAALDVAVRGAVSLDERPVASAVPPPLAVPAPAAGIGLRAALDEFQARWEPGFSGSAGPRYLGFVTGGATPAAVVGDWLTSVFDQNAAGGRDSTAVALEAQTVAWLAELFGVGPAHHGVFVTGATMSNTVGLAVGREWVGERLGVDVSRDGAAALGEVPVLSATPHSSVPKALSMLGLGRDRLRRVPTLPDREAIDVDALAATLAALDGRPAIVVANAGTVNTVDFDDIVAVAALRDRYPFWLHVDAAFGAFAALSPDHAHLVAGLPLADSICLDLHKWLNVPYDSAVQFTRRPDLQVRVFQNTASYLSIAAENPDYMHLTPENSRRLRALAAWFALVAYGGDGHREIVERTVTLTHALGRRIAADPRLRLLAPVRLNVASFTLADDPTTERVAALARGVADSGEAFLTSTVYRGVPGLRAAFSNWRTTEGDVERVAAALSRVAARM